MIRLSVTLLLLIPASGFTQLSTGVLSGTVRDAGRAPAADLEVRVRGNLDFSVTLRTDVRGEFTISLPYGTYRLLPGEVTASVQPSRDTHLNLQLENAELRLNAEEWTLPPATQTWPTNNTGLNDNRLPLSSQRAASWTTTEFTLLGMSATDSYQPGHPMIFPDRASMMAVTHPGDVDYSLNSPRAGWHFGLSTTDSGKGLASSNLPASPSQRGLVQQNQNYRWFSNDGFDASGPIRQHGDISVAGSMQVSSQTMPLESPGTSERTGMLFGNVRGRYRPKEHDQIDWLYSGSRLALSNFGLPMGLESIIGRRMAPSLILNDGFPGQREVDHLDFLQTGWDHWFGESARGRILEVRYQYSAAHLDAQRPPAAPQSRIELLTGEVSGAPPISNLAIRTRQEIRGAVQAGHGLIVGAGWTTSSPENRFSAPSNENIITVGGVPAFRVLYNTPENSRSAIRTFNTFAAEHLALGGGFGVEFGMLSEVTRGSVPGGGSIAWNSAGGRAGFVWQVPRFHRLVLRGGIRRSFAPMAGRYLDFGDPNGPSGTVFGADGKVRMRFGGEWSSIAPGLDRPYAREIEFEAAVDAGHGLTARLIGFRRDDLRRLAALDTGLPASAFTPVTITDPLSGRPMTVYQQSPSTFGQDQYLLTNPPGLRSFNAGVTAALGYGWRGLTVRFAFTAEKSFGPNNPGNNVLENDPGVIGALFQDPNTTINASGRNYLDYGFTGRAELAYRLPWRVEIASMFDYRDGVAFAQEVPVLGLAQGPFLAPASQRLGVFGPGGEIGFRAEYVGNWNLRVARRFPAGLAGIVASVDVLNVMNADSKMLENPLTSVLRSPVAFQEPRWIRLGVRVEF
jgi:hypothetical protein